MINKKTIRNTIFLSLSLLSIQGTIYALQLLASTKMTILDYSQIRLIESFVALFALASSIGLPSIALVKSANATSKKNHKQLILHCSFVISIFFTAISLGLFIALVFGFFEPRVDIPLPIVLTLSALISFRLLLVNITQGTQKFSQLAIISLTSLILTILFYYLTENSIENSILNWILTRIILESIICIGLLIANLFLLTPNDFYSKNNQKTIKDTPRTLFFSAFPVGISLILRSIIEHGPILWLAYIKAPVPLIAELGFILTISTIALMPSGVIQGVILPKLSIIFSEKSIQKKELQGIILSFGISLGATALFFISISCGSISFIPMSSFITLEVILAGLAIVTSKVVASTLGTYLLASNRSSSILSNNLFTFLTSALAALIFELKFKAAINLTNILWTISLIEAFASSLYIKSIKL